MMKSLVVCLLISASVQQSFLALDNTQDFITGFLIGTGLIVRIPEAFPCAIVIDGAKKNIIAAIDEIKKGTIVDIIKGIQDLTHEINLLTHSCGDAFLELEQALVEIKNIVTDKAFPKEAAARAYEQAERIGRDVAEIIVAQKNGDSINVGLRAGDIVSVLLWKQ